MAHWVSAAFGRMRLGILGVAVALSIAACGSVGVGSGPSQGPTSANPPPGSGTANTPPVISGTPADHVIAGQTYSFTPDASDADGDALTFTITNQPDWATFDASTGQLSGTPTAANAGTFANIQITVSDGQDSAALAAFSVDVLTPLTITGSPTTQLVAGTNYSFVPSTDGSAATLTFAVQNLPPWASFDTSTGELSGTASQAGTFAGIVISVTDGAQTAALPAFTVTVTAPNQGNDPPTISGHPATGVVAGNAYVFTPAAADPNGNPLTFSIQNQPVWASFNPASGTLSGTPTSGQAGTYSNIVISVSDGKLSASLAPFSIKVTAPLTIAGNPATQVVAGKSYSFQPTTNAPAGSVTFSIKNRPAWATFSASSGMLSGTPATAQAGSFAGIVISVSNGVQTVSLPTFTIKVVAPLAISGTPPTSVVAGKGYSFQPTTNAPSGTALTFSIQNKPSWASFSSSTGLLSGTPASNQTGSYSNIGISVSDGTQSSALAAFSITVKSADSTPTISGNPPASVNVGSNYSFTPKASDPNGNSLTFSIQNKPAWASFSTASGSLTGTPAAASAGSYSNIIISVSNGTASAALAPFSIKVNQVSNGSATLTWTPVTENTNGTVLTNLAGYNVHYGTSPNSMNTVVQLDNPSLTTYVVGNLASGTWYFGVAAYTSAGTEGVVSNVGSKTIP